jgi:cbb3-type cytochrome oxidase subunit 3
MDSISSGLSTYANLKAYASTAFGFCMMCCAIGFLFTVYNKHYKKALNSNIKYFKNSDQNECTPTDISDKLCSLYVSYLDNQNTSYVEPINSANKVNPGPTTVYYENNKPSSYTITNASPFMGPGIVCCFSLIIILFGIGQIYFFKHNKNAAAVVGGLSLADDVFDRFKN